MRISMIIVVCSCFAASVGVVAATSNGERTSLYNFVSFAGGITQTDPIITGVRVSQSQLAYWQIAKERYDECGLCGEGQVYPDDLPK